MEERLNAPQSKGELVPAAQGAVAVSNANSLLQAITAAASSGQTDVDKIERLFALHQKVVAQEAEAAFNGAMSRAQAEIQPVAHNAFNSQTQSRYTKLAALCKQITPIVTRQGLSISFNTGDAAEGYMRTVAIVAHDLGHKREYHLDLPYDDSGAKGTVNKTKVHAAGSTSSYARRYLTCMIFNVSTEDDDDAQKAGNRQQEIEPDAEGKAALEKCGSLDALKKAWGGLTAKQRSTLNAVKDECKKKIEAADKQA